MDYTWSEHDKSVTAIVKQKMKRSGHELNDQMRFEITVESRRTFGFDDFIPLYMSSRLQSSWVGQGTSTRTFPSSKCLPRNHTPR
jgi:hypothetical protein